MSDRVFIGVAWPYANGSLHLGHLAGSLLPPDIFRRYHRLRGRQAVMVSGSDEHGTPITVTADKRKVTPAQVADEYHREHVKTLERFGIQFDLFFRTSDTHHKEVVWDIFNKLLEKGLIYKKEIVALFCGQCSRFLPDRYVEGKCPHCASVDARGDQCDACGKPLDPTDLKEPKCKLCGSTPGPRTTEHFFFKLSALQQDLENYISDKKHWRAGTINFTRNWLKEGLRDRAITRDLQWGVEIPLPGYDTKRIYVWFEAVIGYLSTSREWARRKGAPNDWERFWKDPSVRSYYFLGKDNIPFHTIIWPAILHGYGGLNLPYDVPANEFLSFAGEKFSKSKGIGIELPAYLDRFDADAMRYYLTINMPELHDTDFTWEEFVRKNNDELVGTLGNFVNRVLTFTFKNFGMVPAAAEEEELDREATRMIESTYHNVEKHLEACQFKPAMKEVMNLAQFGNRFIDTKAPWKLLREDKTRCGGALYVCLRLTKALAMLVYPFLPFSGRKLWKMLGEEGDIGQSSWEDGKKALAQDRKLPKPDTLFKKLELADVLGISAKPESGGKMAPAPAKDAAGKAGAPQMPQPPAAQSSPEESGAWFDKALIRIGKVLEVSPHPSADKLLVAKIDLGTETRQIVAGMRMHYKPDEMLGKHVAVIVNLEPAKLRGMESQGMMFAFDDEKAEGKRIALVVPASEVKTGERVLALGRPAVQQAPSMGIKDFQKAEMRGAAVTALQGEKAVLAMPGRTLEASVNPNFKIGLKVAVLLADTPAVLVTESGVPLVPEREIADGSKIR